MTRRWIALPLCAILLAACATPEEQPLTPAEEAAHVHQSVQLLTDVMVHDIFSPPLASRSYAYALAAFYEAMRHQDTGYASYAGQLNGLDAPPAPDTSLRYDWLLAGTQAFMRVGETMVFSEDRFREGRDELMAALARRNVPDDVAARSMAYGEAVAAHVLAWADADGYKQTRSLPRYTVVDTVGAWKPTPPAYMEPIEPHWNTLRPFVLARADQFVTARPPAFSMEPGTPFYQDVVEVYEAGRQLTDERRAIAAFWDCNPFVMHEQGHLAYGFKKISPGAHWIGIVEAAARQRGDTAVEALAAYSWAAVTLADAFIVSWDEKYRSNVIRPETVIRAHLDPAWKPVLQTPPFPEYTSGHSVVSTAAATVLTHLYGDNFAYTDSVEVDYGLPARSYGSFLEAAEEAAISRLYGGIHYRPAIENGIEQGRRVGALAVDRIRLTSGAERLAAH